MDYNGPVKKVRVRIAEGAGFWLRKYVGQECDAILYGEPPGADDVQVDSEQLSPPLPKWQHARLSDLVVL